MLVRSIVFGCLHLNKTGKYDYTSFSANIPCERIFKIIELNDEIIFCSRDKLIVFGKNDQLKRVILPIGEVTDDSYFQNVFKVSNTLYVSQAGKGLFRLENNKLKLIPNGEYFKNIDISYIRPVHKHLEILSAENGFFEYHNGRIENIILPFLQDVRIRGAEITPDRKLCIYSTNHGIYIVDSLYREYSHLLFHNGVAYGRISGVLFDSYGNIWTAGENGFNFIAYNSSFVLFDRMDGLPGKIHSVVKMDSFVFIGSTMGLYYYNKKDAYTFRLYNNLTASVYSIIKINDQLIVSTDKGLYTIKKNVLQKISKKPVQYVELSRDKKSFFCISKNGIMQFGAESKYAFGYPNRRQAHRKHYGLCSGPISEWLPNLYFHQQCGNKIKWYRILFHH